MTSFHTDCATMIGGKLMDVIKDEARYICCFKSIVEENKQVQQNLKDWCDDRAAYQQQQVKKLLVTGDDTETCFWGWCPNCIRQYRRGKEMVQRTKDIREFMKSESAGLAPGLPGVEYHSSQDYVAFESRESNYKELWDALLDDNNYMIGLQGLGGTGKTTLAREVGKKLKNENKFDHVIDTTVSKTPDIKKIQDDIATPFGLALKDYSESERPKRLWKRLVDAKKVLIILDDVWDWKHIDFEDIGIPRDHKDCKVLLTTRNLSICHAMKCQRIIQLEILSTEDAWNMFKKYADISDNSKLEAKGQEIAKECKGLPVAIAVIARTLKGRQHLEEWNAALIALQSSMPWHVDDENLIEIYKCFRYSYDNMKNEKAKGLFLICSLFREDEEIPTEILTRFGIGVGLFKDVDNYHAARSQVVVAINELIDSCLLLKTERGHVKMHDMVREAALWIANKEIQAVELSNRSQKALVEREKTIRYLLCEGQDKDVFSCSFDGTKLEILVIYASANDDAEFSIPDAFFERVIELRVLYLSRKGWRRQALSLPQLHQSLRNIRSLFLERLILGKISVLGTLRSLETLDLIYCSIHELPNNFTDLEKLRLLSFKNCEIKMNNPFEVIERCSPLEELYFKGNGIRQVESVNKVEAIQQNKEFPRWQRYHVARDPEDIDDSMSKVFKNKGFDALIPEATSKYLWQKAEIVELEGFNGESRNLIPEIVLMENDLVKLHLISCSKLQHLIDSRDDFARVQNVFSKLVDLRLDCMDNLEELCSGPLPINLLKSLETLDIDDCEHLRSILFKSKLNLCNLKIMKLTSCPMLVSLFQLSTARSLVRLEELRISECEQLTNIVTDEGTGEGNGEEMVDGDNDHKIWGSMFPNLRTLDIMDCDSLKFMLHLSARDVQERYHPMSSSAKRSSSKVGSKAQLQSAPAKCNIFPWTHICWHAQKFRRKLGSTTSTTTPVASNDKLQDYSMTSVSNSQYLHLWERAQCLSKQSQMLCNIRKIRLRCLRKIKSLFVLSIAQTMSLETLKIEDCDELKRIIIMDIGDDRVGRNWGDVLPKLKKLYVEDCGQLEYVFGQYPHAHQNYNESHLHLPALEKVKLCGLPNFISVCPKNCRTTWPPLKEFEFNECPQFTTFKSIGDLMVDLDSRQQDSATTKELRENVKHFLNLEKLNAVNSNVESIFRLNGHHSIGQQISLRLQSMSLDNLHQMTYIFVGPKNSFALQNLEDLSIEGCEKLEVIFPASTLSSLPQLRVLSIENCKELKQIIEDDSFALQNLEDLSIVGCEKLEVIFPASTLSSLPQLRVLRIENCKELKQFIEDDSFALQNLEDLRIVGCEKLEVIFLASTLSSLPPLRVLRIENCKELKHVDVLENQKLPNQNSFALQKLEDLRIVGCEKLEVIFPASTLSSLPQLRVLRIENYKQLKLVDVLENQKLPNQNSFALQNLEDLSIVGCEKLEVIFPASTLSSVPQLRVLRIENCKELKQIIEDDVDVLENQKLPNQLYLKPCFPKLGYLIVTKCNKLKRFFPVYTSKGLPKLEFLMISEASELEEVFGCEQSNQKVELPNLKCVIFMQLPCLCQETQLQTVRFRIVDNCPKLSMTSSNPAVFLLTPWRPWTIREKGFEFAEIDDSYELWEMLCELINSAASRHYDKPRSDVDSIPQVASRHYEETRSDSDEDPITQRTSNQSPTTEINEDFPVAPEVQAASGRELPSSDANTNQSAQANLDKFNEHDSNEVMPVETKIKCTAEPEKEFVERVSALEMPSTAISPTDSELIRKPGPTPLDIPLQKTHSHCPKESEDQSIQEGSTSEKTVTTTLSTGSEAKNTSPGPLLDPLQKSIKRSVEEGTTSENGKKEAGDGQIPRTSSVVTTEHPATKDVDVRDSYEASEFVVTTIDIQVPGVSESKPSPRIPFPVTTQAPSLPKDVLLFEGNSSQIEEDSNVASLVTRELEQLVSSKHLAPENLSLLIDFLMKHPSVRLIDKVHSDEYKGFAYNRLADLLIFLQTHSALDVLGSSRSDFVKLLQDVRTLGFDKDWLDTVERRAFFHGIQVPQDALQKLLDSKHILTQHVEDLKHQLASSEAVLESVIHQEAQILEATAALSAPLGY